MTLRCLHVDHSGAPGGGQLGLLRLMESSASVARTTPVQHQALFLVDGPVVDSMRQSNLLVDCLGMSSSGLLQMLKMRTRILNRIREIDPDVVVANSLRAAVGLALLGSIRTPIYYYLRQDMTAASMGSARRLVFSRLIVKRFAGLLANSRWTLETVPNYVSTRNRAVSYPVSGLDRFLESRSEIWLGDGPVELVWIGRLAEWKGLDTLIEACDDLWRIGFQFRVRVAGAGIHEGEGYANRIRSLAGAKPYSVEFLGHVEDVAGLFSTCHIVAHTSLMPEPYGQVVAQALASGLPTIVSRGGGATEIAFRSRGAMLVPPGDPDALASAIQRIAQNHEFWVHNAERDRPQVLESFGDRAGLMSFEEALRSFFTSVER